MPLYPPVAEDIIRLLDKYPDLTPTQITILKSAAAYLVRDEDEGKDIDRKAEDWDPRLSLTEDEYEVIPDRIELDAGGIPAPSNWNTPNRLAAAERYRQRENDEKQALIDSGPTAVLPSRASSDRA